jgi:dolichol-phosphate mannosyltransferase
MKPVDEATMEEPVATGKADETATAAEWTWRLVRRIHLGTRKPANWMQLFKFGVVGATGYFVNLAVFAALVELLSLHHIPAAIGAFCVAVMNNFLWNRHWTFRAADGHAGFQAARFFAVSLTALAVNLIVLSLLVDVAEAPELPSQAFAVAFAMPLNFIGNKLWTFDRG